MVPMLTCGLDRSKVSAAKDRRRMQNNDDDDGTGADVPVTAFGRAATATRRESVDC